MKSRYKHVRGFLGFVLHYESAELAEGRYFYLSVIFLQVTVHPLSAKFIKWSNTLKQIAGKLPTICLSVFDYFSGLAFKGLIPWPEIIM